MSEVAAMPLSQRIMDPSGKHGTSDPTAMEVSKCRVVGSGCFEAAVRHPATFTIEAHDLSGSRREVGGDTFFVCIRGDSRVHCRVVDQKDGSYFCQWTPPQSGNYSISVSSFGVHLPGSPFNLRATAPEPFAQNCVVTGRALAKAIARDTQTFQVGFKDGLGNTTRAVDLDVYVERLPVAGVAATEGERAPPLGVRSIGAPDTSTEAASSACRLSLSTLRPPPCSTLLHPPPPSSTLLHPTPPCPYPAPLSASLHPPPSPPAPSPHTLAPTRTFTLDLGH